MRNGGKFCRIQAGTCDTRKETIKREGADDTDEATLMEFIRRLLSCDDEYKARGTLLSLKRILMQQNVPQVLILQVDAAIGGLPTSLYAKTRSKISAEDLWSWQEEQRRQEQLVNGRC